MNLDALIKFFSSNPPVSIIFVFSLISIVISSYRLFKLPKLEFNQLTMMYIAILVMSAVGIIYTYKAHEVFYAVSHSPAVMK